MSSKLLPHKLAQYIIVPDDITVLHCRQFVQNIENKKIYGDDIKVTIIKQYIRTYFTIIFFSLSPYIRLGKYTTQKRI